MLAPYLAGLSLLVILPAVAGFGLAFADYNALQPPRFVGLANFRDLLDDEVFRIAIGNSLLYIALAVPLRLAGALLTALLLLRPIRGMHLYRAIVYLPTVIPDLAWAFIEFAVGPVGQTILAETGRIVPSLRSVAESDSFLKGTAAGLIRLPPARASVFLDNIPVVRPMPSITTLPAVEQIFNQAFKQAFYVDADIPTAVGRVVADSRGILGNLLSPSSPNGTRPRHFLLEGESEREE